MEKTMIVPTGDLAARFLVIFPFQELHRKNGVPPKLAVFRTTFPCSDGCEIPAASRQLFMGRLRLSKTG
jgi:hypothetical protein